MSKNPVFFKQPVVYFIQCNTYFYLIKQKKQQSLIFVRVIATFLFPFFKVEINFSLQL